MRMGAMLSDIIASLFRRPATRKYPFEQTAAPTRLRGKLEWDPEKCTGCCLCAKECPADALEVIVLDRKAKQFVMRYDIDKCIYCGQCVENCRFGCLEMSNEDWELAATTREPFTVYYGEQTDIDAFLETITEPGTEVPEKA